jgi:2,6-dihydroxypseudooxynicotine hydrolase
MGQPGMTAIDERPGPSHEGPPVEQPVVWRYTPEAWRLARRLTPRFVDLYLRARGGHRLPGSFRARFAAMQLPGETVDRALSEIRGLGDWMPAWNRAAQRRLGEARREDASGRWQEAAIARRHAAMCFHAAHLITDTDARTVRTLRATSVTVFGQALPLLMPRARRLTVAWRNHQLPAYLSLPADKQRGPAPLVVLLNGATTTKEEMLLWSQPFLDEGLCVLAIDWPGTGEAISVRGAARDCDDITDGILAVAMDDPHVDAGRVALLGFSLGGALAVRAAALDRRIAACITVTSPYDPSEWVYAVNPIVQDQLIGIGGEEQLLEDLAQAFALCDITHRVRCPLLIFGAGRDFVVPPEESLRLATATAPQSTLVWYPDGGHGLYRYVDDWTAVAGQWLSVLLEDAASSEDLISTRVDMRSSPSSADA